MKPHTLLRAALALCLVVATSLSCSDAVVDNKYCQLPARFNFTPVTSISQLYTSCNSQGEWCTITYRDPKFIFTNLSGTGEANKTALAGYTGFYMGLSGFIVGLPNMPEVGADMPVLTCFDLACSNCYEAKSTTKPLTLQQGGYAHCASCQRTYNLNNVGIVSSGEAGRALYRYRVYYASDHLAIDNR